MQKSRDQFEVWNVLAQSRRGWLLRALLPWIIAFIGFMFFLIANYQPLPVVVVDEVSQEPFALDDTSVREVDVKRFMVRQAALMHGWSSASVLEDLTKARSLMTVSQSERFQNDISSVVTTADGEMPLINSYVLSRSRNRLTFDFSTIECRRLKTEWECHVDVDLYSSPMFDSRTASQRPTPTPRVFRISAKFVEVPLTLKTLDALLVSSWVAKERF